MKLGTARKIRQDFLKYRIIKHSENGLGVSSYMNYKLLIASSNSVVLRIWKIFVILRRRGKNYSNLHHRACAMFLYSNMNLNCCPNGSKLQIHLRNLVMQPSLYISRVVLVCRARAEVDLNKSTTEASSSYLSPLHFPSLLLESEY